MLIRTGGLPLIAPDSDNSEIGAAIGRWKEAAEAMKTARDQLPVFESERETDGKSPVEKAVMTMRRRLRKMFLQPVALVQPVPEILERERPELADVLHAWNKAVAQQNSAHEHWKGNHAQALERCYKRLQTVAGETSFQRSLLFASRDLLAGLEHFRQKPTSGFAKKDRQQALSVYQYQTRALFKTSPFSRFTTVSAVALDELPDPDPEYGLSQTVVTPNVGLLPALYDVLLKEPDFYRSLRVRLNPCLTASPVDDRWEWLYFDGTRESFQQAPADPVTHWVVNFLLENNRSVVFNKLWEAFCGEVEGDAPLLEQYLLRLVATGMLEWELPERGLAANWTGSLFNYLGFLPAAPVIVETAALLRWLRAAARSMPFQSVGEARMLQEETGGQIHTYFAKFNHPAPEIPLEHLFFEDVEEPVHCLAPGAVIRNLIAQLTECWSKHPAHRQPRMKSALANHAKQTLQPGETIPFLTFSQRFLSQTRDETAAFTPVYQGKIGAVIQVYREGDAWKAVVNGLFPGGGKLFARWLHVLTADFRGPLQKWQEGMTTFPWQGWSNANFQPATHRSLQVPYGRVVGVDHALLGRLIVKNGADGPELLDGDTGLPVQFTDLGLEAPETRPPVMQVLYHLGIPYVSLDALVPRPRASVPIHEQGRYLPRVEYGDLVLARAAWKLESAFYEPLSAFKEADFYVQAREWLTGAGVSRHFFVQHAGVRPQYIDAEDPLAMQLLGKILRQAEGICTFTEMLPLPEQWVVEKDGLRASEFVIELAVG
jgi:hypothetical protein